MTLFQGLSAFPLTPADPRGRVDVGSLRGLLDRLVAARVGSIGLLGSTGTYAYLDRAERRRAVETAVEAAGGQVPVMVGIGALRTDEAVRLGQDAKAAGADAVLLAPVSYTPLADEEVFAHFTTVAEAVGLPLCIYDNPGTTRFSFGDALIARLSRVPWIAAIKTPAGEPAGLPDRLRALRERAAPGFSIGHSVDWHAVEAMLAGGTTWYSVAAGLFPVACTRIADAASSGDAAAARRLDAEMRPLWDLFIEHSSLRVMHAAANRLGLSAGQPPLPILPLPPAAQQRVAEVLEMLRLE